MIAGRSEAPALTPIAAVLAALLAGCAPSQPTRPAAATPTSLATPTDSWRVLQEKKPFSYTLPLPPAVSTAIDGVYVKREPLVGERVHCRRCPDWAPEGGLWKMGFDRGAYRVLHLDTGWRSLGSYAVSGDRLTLFNDPYCVEDIGLYTWRVDRGALTLRVIDDPCAIRLRGKNLAHLPWIGCQPPGAGGVAAVRWERPAGCE